MAVSLLTCFLVFLLFVFNGTLTAGHPRTHSGSALRLRGLIAPVQVGEDSMAPGNASGGNFSCPVGYVAKLEGILCGSSNCSWSDNCVGLYIHRLVPVGGALTSPNVEKCG
eukprot:RCo051814